MWRLEVTKNREEETEHAHKACTLYTNRNQTQQEDDENPFSLSVAAEEQNILRQLL